MVHTDLVLVQVLNATWPELAYEIDISDQFLAFFSREGQL